MTVQMENTHEELVVWLSGELDHHAARSLREQVDAMVERVAPKRLRLDFNGVTFMDSSGVGLVMGRYRLMKLLGGRLVVAGMSDRIEQMMRMAGLDRLDIWEKEEAPIGASREGGRTNETHE